MLNLNGTSTLFEPKSPYHIVYFVKPPNKAYGLMSLAFLVADAFRRFCLFKPFFRDALKQFFVCIRTFDL